jgi:hypothetical protein
MQLKSLALTLLLIDFSFSSASRGEVPNKRDMANYLWITNNRLISMAEILEKLEKEHRNKRMESIKFQIFTESHDWIAEANYQLQSQELVKRRHKFEKLRREHKIALEEYERSNDKICLLDLARFKMDFFCRKLNEILEKYQHLLSAGDHGLSIKQKNWFDDALKNMSPLFFEASFSFSSKEASDRRKEAYKNVLDIGQAVVFDFGQAFHVNMRSIYSMKQLLIQIDKALYAAIMIRDKTEL